MPYRKFMPQLARPVLSAAAILMATTLAARADLTPSGLWQDWQAQASAAGQELSAGNATDAGGTLTLTDVAFSAMHGSDRISGTIPQVALTGAGDAVDVTFSPEYPLVVESTLPPDPEALADGEEEEAVPTRMTLLISHPGLALHATGEPEDVTYQMTMPTLTATLKEMETGETVDGSLALQMTASGVTGTYRFTGAADADRKVDTRTQVEAAGLTLSQSGPEGEEAMTDGPGGSYQMVLSAQSVETLSTGALPVIAGGATFADLIRLSASGTLSHGPVSLTLTETDPEGELRIVEATAERGSADYALTQGQVAYKGETEAGRLSVSGGPEAPPMSLTADRANFDAAFPARIAETAEPFRFMSRLEGVRADDLLWQQVDPTGILPRDPALISLALSGAMRWLADPSDPSAMGEAPYQFETVNIDDLDISAIGAGVKGRGAFTIDNSDLTTWDGLPKPVGGVDLTIRGSDQAVDRLVQLGLLAPQQAMVAKMMLQGFSRPGPEPGTLTTRIELTQSGSIRANGKGMLP